MTLIPEYLIILIIICVVVPSIIAVFLRMTLQGHLVRLGSQVRRLIYQQSSLKKPKIVDYLEQRLAEASRDLETVNTAALIDQVYSQEKVLLISCEQIDYFCRILPNLLLAFGLLGTFIGITINLASLSQTVSATDINDISSLLRQIQEPLKGMGIAFSTSLVGILFSAFITIVNFLFNTTLAKYRLLSALEDYLDNIYRPSLQGQTRFDRVVQSMVDTFDGFLLRFGQKIQESIEVAVQDKVQEIFEAHLKATQLAEQVYSRLIDASIVVTNSAQDFKIAADRFIEVAQMFEKNQFPQQLSTATSELAIAQRNFSQSASNLATSIQSIEIAGIELQNYSKRLLQFGEKINQNQQTTIDLLEFYQKNQQSLSNLVSQLQTSTQAFQLAVNTLDTLQRRMVTKTDNFDELHAELNKLVMLMPSYTEGIRLAIEGLSDRLTQTQPTQPAQFQPILENLQHCVNYLHDTKNELYRLRHTLEQSSKN